MDAIFQYIVESEYMPHGHCYFWEPYILWSHALSDGIIALAYMTIPLTLIYIFRRRKDFKFIWMMVLFAIFIFGCGITHVFDVVTIWNPVYRADSVARIITALASIGTAIVLVRITPNILSIPTAQQWIEVNEQLKAQLLELQAKDKTIEAFKEFEALTETLPQLVWTNDASGKVRFFNQRWYAYTGLPFMESIEQLFQQLLPPGQHSAVETRWKEALRSGNTFEQELYLKQAGGQYRWHLARAVPLHTSTQLWVCTLTDIDDQKAAQRELAEKNKELLRTNTDLDNFIYTASHDLRAPIANIEGIATQLSRRLNLKVDETEQELLNLLSYSAVKLKKTINDLSEIAKVQKESGESDEEIVFKEVLDDVKGDIQELISQSGVQISENFEAAAIHFQRKNLRSILYNLVTNAIKFRSPDRPGQVHIRTYTQDGWTILSVEDNGLGISPNYRQKLFQMFKRFHPHVEGTGIGLYIVKRIVENTGGKIEVDSEVDSGTTFRLYFPASLTSG
jgi:PAS domain S-box-containing protein